MFRRMTAAVLALLIPSLVDAGPLKESIARAAKQEAARPVQQGWSKTRWSGVVLAGGGAALVVAGLLDGKQNGPDADQIEDHSTSDGERESRSDKALMWTGIGAAALGSTLFVLGGSKGPRASVGAGKVALLQTIRF